MRRTLVLLLATSCIAAALWAAESPVATANATNQFQITGMSCDGCGSGIASELKRLPGVGCAQVTFSNKLAVVAYDTNRVSADGLKKAIVEAGYDAKLMKARKAIRP